jgi:hypothetical protein
LPDHNHSSAAGLEYCETCGHSIAPPSVYGAGISMSQRIGIAVSVLLHLSAVLYYFMRDEPVRRAPPPAQEGAIAYIAPLADKPGRTTQPKSPPRPAEPVKLKPPVRQRPEFASTKAPRPKEEIYVPPVVAPLAAPMAAPITAAPEEDMFARVAAARKRRLDANGQTDQAPQESDAERATRVARANIAGAQGRNSGSDQNDSGGVFAVINLTSHSADINFRGWNGNFKRNWTKQERVEQGAEIDIEIAIVKKMMDLIRKEKPGDFIWESHRLGRQVPLSARMEDAAELQTFLLREFFPDYRRRAR